MPVSFETYKRVALEDPEGQWELVCGRLRQKPIMAFKHNDVMDELQSQLRAQLPRSQFLIRSNSGRVRISSGTYYVPDLFVIPRERIGHFRDQPEALEIYADPMPLVVEVWSPPTGEYDVESKLPEYQQRGDAEIWRIHPYERTLTAWRRQPDGTYTETRHTGGTIAPAALPGVTIDIGLLFD